MRMVSVVALESRSRSVVVLFMIVFDIMWLGFGGFGFIVVCSMLNCAVLNGFGLVSCGLA